MKRNHCQNSCLLVNTSNLLLLDKFIKSSNWLIKSMDQIIKLTNQFYKSMYQLIKTSNRFNKSMDRFTISSFWFKSSNNFGMAHQFLTSIQTSIWERRFDSAVWTGNLDLRTVSGPYFSFQYEKIHRSTLQ